MEPKMLKIRYTPKVEENLLKYCSGLFRDGDFSIPYNNIISGMRITALQGNFALLERNDPDLELILVDADDITEEVQRSLSTLDRVHYIIVDANPNDLTRTIAVNRKQCYGYAVYMIGQFQIPLDGLLFIYFANQSTRQIKSGPDVI